MPFDLTSLLNDPQFAGGMTMLGTANQPGGQGMIEAYKTMIAMQKAQQDKTAQSSLDQYRQAQIKMDEEHSRLYARQVTTAEDNARREAENAAVIQQLVQRHIQERFGNQSQGGQSGPALP